MNLSKTQEHIINGWINQLDIKNASLDDLKWVHKNHKKINNHIMNSPYAIGTKRNYINLLGVILRELGYDKLYDGYNRLTSELNKQHDKQEKKQCMTDKEKINFVSHGEIKNKIDELDQYKNNSKIDNYKHLALSLYWYQPPIRNNYPDMIVAKGNPNNYISNGDMDQNELTKFMNNYYIVINDDKVSNTYGSAVIDIVDNELTKILNNSFNKYPRTYVFEGIEPLNFRKSFLPSLFDNKNVSIDILRSSYITWFYGSNHSLADKEQLAYNMRHSKAVAELAYCKIDTKDRYKRFKTISSVQRKSKTN